MEIHRELFSGNPDNPETPCFSGGAHVCIGSGKRRPTIFHRLGQSYDGVEKPVGE